MKSIDLVEDIKTREQMPRKKPSRFSRWHFSFEACKKVKTKEKIRSITITLSYSSSPLTPERLSFILSYSTASWRPSPTHPKAVLNSLSPSVSLSFKVHLSAISIMYAFHFTFEKVISAPKTPFKVLMNSSRLCRTCTSGRAPNLRPELVPGWGT